SRVRTRALTLPPTDELRRMIEEAAGKTGDELTASGSSDTPVRKPGSIGRRATDRGDESDDRRREQDRRASAARLALANGGNASAALAQQLDPEAEPELIGSEVDDRYRVIELIGEGGMGKVYLAEHIEIGKRVALKVLHPSYSRMPDLVERFRREARAASKIGHPNIVDVTDSGTTGDGSVYFVMEFLEGVELGSVIEREGAINVARALRIAGQICRALAAAHTQGIVHRDLKPENVFLITRDGAADVVKVLDFGIAKTTEAEAARERRLTSPGMAMGTPEYMSPEQAAGRPADARCDVYALGAIVYEMVTGMPPYSGDNFMEILTKKATQDPPPPHTVRNDLPPAISDLVMAAMARSPDDRPQTMETFEYELNKCLAGRGVAVAQILGMTTDPNVVATLNPGLSMRNLEDGAVVPRTSTSSPVIGIQRAGTLSGVTEIPSITSGPVSMSTTGQYQIPGRPISEPSAASSGSMSAAASFRQPSGSDYASQPVIVKRSAAGALGWLLLGALLFGGIGTVLYIALGERGARAPSQVDDSIQPAGSPAGDSDGVGSGSAEPPDPKSVVKPDDRTKNATTNKKPQTVRTPPKKLVAVADEKDPKALIKQGKALEKNGDWELARGLYMKLEKIKGYAGQALYLQAWAAFQAQDTDAAVALSKKAAEQPGPHKTDAMFLYADALFRKGDPERAKLIYLNLRKKLTGDERATATKKIAACNKALKLPEADGITN
ncbi:MAG: protein kinase, partial [Myxococcota bacterium]|nr:protein kinase [Myxococcota bacterium]